MIQTVLKGYLGTQTPYIYERTRYTLPPKGYQPFFINHLGRHGARYLASTGDLKQIIQSLQDAANNRLLTQCGEQILEQLIKILPVEISQEGLLIPSGYQMEEGIAQRMVQRDPKVFGRKIVAVSTYVERTKQSMVAFLGELACYMSPQLFEVSSNGEVDPILRFFDLNEAYLNYKEDGNWKPQYEMFRIRQQIADGVLKRIFISEGINQIQKPQDWVKQLYNIWTNLAEVHQGKTDLWMWTQEELSYLWENENVRQYLLKGPSNVGQSQPTNIAFPLLMDFLATSETAIKERNQSAYLRFAHAETIMPFAGMIRLLGFFNQTNAMKQVAELWQDYWVGPMAANMQWIFYEHPFKKAILLKILYNESEVRLPLRSSEGPYYDYQTVKAFYLQQLKAMALNWHVSLVDMVRDYVQNCACVKN